jgi:hypothetical protein
MGPFEPKNCAVREKHIADVPEGLWCCDGDWGWIKNSLSKKSALEFKTAYEQHNFAAFGCIDS